MTEATSRPLGLMAKLVIALAVLLIVAGVAWHGVTVATVLRVWHQLIERADAPMRFRFVLQPLMAAVVAIRDGRNDARAGRSAFFWAVLNRPDERIGRLREGLNATARIILLGIAMDVIYQLIVLRRFYPAEAVIIAIALAFVPYVLIRGPVARIARRWRRDASPMGRTS